MDESTQPIRRARFGPFDVDFSLRQIRKHGIRIKVHDQPLRVLAMLVARPNEVVTREEIGQKLWPSGTFVDFENGLNSAVNRLRDALGDSADAAKYIETIPRHGYRFIAPVEILDGFPPLATGSTTAAQRQSWRRPAWIAAALAIVIALSSVATWYVLRGRKAGITFQARDWVLITNFENRTGEPILDGSLEYALERELSDSQFVNVVPRERVNDVLRLMRKPLDAKIDASLGREVCLRDGQIHAMLTGRVEKLGSTYVLNTKVVDPLRGVTVASLSEEDTAESQMVAAVHRLTIRVRKVLGENSRQISQGTESLEKVTTPSLEALQLYSKSNELMLDGKNDVATELLERAVQDDPTFASGHLLLGWAYVNDEKRERAAPHFQRAFELADSTPDRERFFILGSYYSFRGEDQKAVAAYEALLRLYPDHYWGTNNLSMAYEELGQYDEASAFRLRCSEMRPNSFPDNAIAAFELLGRDENLVRAKPYLLRAQALASPETVQLYPWASAKLLLVPAYAHWLNGEAALALDDARVVEQAIGPKRGEERDIVLATLGGFYVVVGKLRAAEDLYQRIERADMRDIYLGRLAYFKKDWRAARELLNHAPQVGMGDVVEMARMGYLADAEKMLESIAPDVHDPGALEIARGELALAQGRTREGLTLIQSNLHLPHATSLLGVESLAAIYERRGNLAAAAKALEKAYILKSQWLIDGMTSGMPFNPTYIRICWRLAQLYRKLGRVDEAQKIETELSKLLAVADSDHPMLLELQKRPQSSSAALLK